MTSRWFSMLVAIAVVMAASLTSQPASAGKAKVPRTAQPYLQMYLWDSGRGYFTDRSWLTRLFNNLESNRLSEDGYRFTTDPLGTKNSYAFCGSGVFAACTTIPIVVRETYQLNSACPWSETSCYQSTATDARIPVLFIHGYMQGTSAITGGGSGTWGDFPRLLKESGYVPFEYRWNTGTRFQDAAVELEKAIDTINEKTGKRVHVVAHSMGGLLIRSLLQGIHKPAADRLVHSVKMELRVASVVTIGTPHSGIFSSDTCRSDGNAFPDGHDPAYLGVGGAPMFQMCGQLTCQQAGQEGLFDTDLAEFYGIDDEAGETIAAILDSSASPLPPTTILSLIGLTTRRGADIRIVDGGDALLSYEGQRFSPDDSFDPASASCIGQPIVRRVHPLPLRDRWRVGDAQVTERLLRFPDDTLPNDLSPIPGDGGYKHSNGVSGTDYCSGKVLVQECSTEEPPAEPYVVCATASGCEHETFKEVLSWLPEPSSPSGGVTFVATGTVLAVDDHLGLLAAIFSTPVTVGDPVTVSVTFDPDAQDMISSDPEFGDYFGDSIAIKVGSNQPIVKSPVEIFVRAVGADGIGSDYYAFRGNDGGGGQMINLELTVLNGAQSSSIPSDALPKSAPSLSLFDMARIDFYADAEYLGHIGATVDTLTDAP